MKFVVLLALLIIFNIACSTNIGLQAEKTYMSPKPTQEVFSNSAESNVNEAKNVKVKSDIVEDHKDKVISTKNSLGLIVLSEKYTSKNEIKDKTDFIRFYNEDGSLWYEFTFYYDDSDGKFGYRNKHFGPLAFHADYFLIALRCIGEDKNRYKVVVNENKQTTKYVKKNYIGLKLQSWSNHILDTFSIDLDKEKNPIFESPEGKQMKLDIKSIDRFEAVEVKNDWLKVKWKTPNEKEEYKSGWVRWKEKDIILVDWFYFA